MHERDAATAPDSGLPDRLRAAVAARPRALLATLPTPLERGPELPGGSQDTVEDLSHPVADYGSTALVRIS